MADYDAQIRLIVSGTRQINELEASLNRVQDLIDELNESGANAIFGRSTSLGTYRAAIAAAQQQANAIRDQVSATQDANSELRQQTLLYSQLNREQALYRRRSSAFTEESRGIRNTNSQVIELTTQLRSAQRAFSEFFKQADLQGARTINAEISSILEQLREINRVATGTKNVGANTEQLQAQADGWNLQIRALRRRASALEENEEILARLSVAERELIGLRNADMTFREEANVRLGRQELSNAEKLIKAEEEIAAMRRRDASEYERTLARQASAIAKIVAQGTKIAGKAAGATLDAVTFGRGPQVIRGTRNAAIRGGIGLGALGLGKLATGLGAAGAATAEFATRGLQGAVGGPAIAIIEKFAQALNSAMGGIPSAVYDVLQALGNIPDALGVAAVAALALAPATNTAAKSIYSLGKAAGNSAIGKPLSGFLRDINPLAGAAYGSIEALTAGIDKLRGQTFDIQRISSAAAEVSAQLKESYEKLPLALPAAGETSFKGSVEYDDVIGAKVGGGVRKALSDTELLVGSTGKLANRSQEAARATLLFAERMSAGSSSASEIVEKFQQGAQEAKRIAEFVRQATELKAPSAETSAQRFIRETIERRRREAQNERSAEIAREGARAVLGGQYSISQLPARGELFPGGRTETRQEQYRSLLNQQAARLNEQAAIKKLVDGILDSMSKQQGLSATIGQLERRSVNDKGKSLSIQQQENDELERSIQIIRERNRELRQRPVAQMTPQERVSQGILDPISLRQQRIQRVKRGRELQAKLGRAGSEGLVGGAFPLLFGQGLGASVGGGLGGALGGFAGGGLGFGLSLVGTGLGSAFDLAVEGAKQLGAALHDLSTVFDTVKERALFSSRETEKLATKLEEAGFAATASIIAQEEIIKKIGQGGARDLRNLETASDRLNRAWAEFSLQLQAALAGPMAGLLEWIARIVGEGNKFRRGYAEIEDIRSGLSEKDRKELRADLNKIDYLSKLPTANPDRITREEALRRQVELANQKYLPRTQQSRTLQASPEARFQSQLAGAEGVLNSLTAQLNALDVGRNLIDQYRQAAQEQEDLDRQRADIAENYERAIGDIRISVERKVQQERFSNAAQENEIFAKQAEIRLQGIRNANALLSQSLAGNEIGQQLFDIVAEYTEQQLSTEDEIANRRRKLELEIQTLAFEAEQYKIDVAKQVADLNRSTAKQVADIQLNVARKNDQATKSRFELEKQIAIAQLAVQRVNAAEERRKLQNALTLERDQFRRGEIQRSIDAYTSVLDVNTPESISGIKAQIENAKAPTATSFAGVSANQGVSTATFEAVNARGIELKRMLGELEKAFDSLVSQGKYIELNTQLSSLADQGLRAADAEAKKLSGTLADMLNPAGASKSLANLEKEIGEGLTKAFGSESLEKSPQSKELKQLIPLYARLISLNSQLAETQQFFNESISDNVNSINALKQEINDAVAGTTAYEKALQSLTARGLDPASEKARELLMSAAELDRVQAKADFFNNMREAAVGFSGSLRTLIEQFIELKDAGDAVAAFSKELGQKSLSFVLDLAFKPIEDAMQKQFISFAGKMGVDIRPEAMKQLSELEGLREVTKGISGQIGEIAKTLTAQQKAAERAAQEAAQRGQGAYGNSAVAEYSYTGSATRTELEDTSIARYMNRYGPEERKYIAGQFSNIDTVAALEERRRNFEVEYGGVIGGMSYGPATRAKINSAVGEIIDEEFNRQLEKIRRFTGQGGPDLPHSMQVYPEPYRDGSGRMVFPMQENGQHKSPVPDGAGGYTDPLGGGLGTPGRILNVNVEKVGGKAVTGVNPAAAAAGAIPVADAMSTVAEKTNTSASQIQGSGDKLLASLGKATTGLAGIAAGVIGVTGGMQQISGGGTYETLMGLAGIFGGISTVTGMFGTGGVFSGAFGGGGGGGGGGTGSSPPPPPKTDVPLPPARALGGPVMGNSPYLVGEQGPELFVPSGSGMIIPNRNRNGGGANPFAATSQQVESYSDRAAMMNSDNSPIKIDSRVINGVEYVTMDQLKEAARQAERRGAEKGRSLAISSLKNSVGTRKRVGI